MVILWQPHIARFQNYGQENTIQKWTLAAQIQTTTTTNNPRNKYTNYTIPTPRLEHNTIRITNYNPVNKGIQLWPFGCNIICNNNNQYNNKQYTTSTTSDIQNIYWDDVWYLQMKRWCNIWIKFDNWNNLRLHEVLDNNNWMDNENDKHIGYSKVLINIGIQFYYSDIN